MKRIEKSVEPRSLTEYRSRISHSELLDSNVYENFPKKTKEGCNKREVDNLRKQLLEEQGYICCYCMSRINCNNSKIEHLKPQSIYKNLQIDYSNLFVACNGGEGNKANQQFCDTKKGESEFKYLDLLRNIENDLEYEKIGQNGIKIFSNNTDLNSDIENILNLNIRILMKNRKEAYNKTIENLKSRGFSISNIKKVKEYFMKKHNGKYEPFCQMIVYFLTKKLKSKGV